MKSCYMKSVDQHSISYERSEPRIHPKERMVVPCELQRPGRGEPRSEVALNGADSLKERFIRIAVSCGCKGLDDHDKGLDRGLEGRSPGRLKEANGRILVGRSKGRDDGGRKGRSFVSGGLELPPGRGDPGG